MSPRQPTDVVDQYHICPYCMCKRSLEHYAGCCGESSAHFVLAYEFENGDLLPEHEIEWLAPAKRVTGEE